jgi:hypothetical protein
MPWTRGREVVDRLLDNAELERVVPSEDLAARLMGDARTHLESAKMIRDLDPACAYQLAYDAVRKVQRLACCPGTQGDDPRRPRCSPGNRQGAVW